MKERSQVSGHAWSNYPVQQDVSEIVYHYTSPGGLFGILQENTLRFTDCRFMNDVSEYIHIRQPFLRALNELKGDLDYDYFSKIADHLFEQSQNGLENFDLPESLNKNLSSPAFHYLFCASRASDSLGMWNHYIKDKNYQGYSIGFKVESLMNCISNIAHPSVLLRHGRVLYDSEQQVELLKNTLREANVGLNELRQSSQEEEENTETTTENYLRAHLNSFRLFFKDESFQDEREYRFVLSTTQRSEQLFPQDLIKGYTSKNGLFIPHIDLPFRKADAIQSIKAAPMIEFQLAKIGLQRFLQDHGYDGDKIEIRHSTIPIRF